MCVCVVCEVYWIWHVHCSRHCVTDTAHCSTDARLECFAEKAKLNFQFKRNRQKRGKIVENKKPGTINVYSETFQWLIQDSVCISNTFFFLYSLCSLASSPLKVDTCTIVWWQSNIFPLIGVTHFIFVWGGRVAGSTRSTDGVTQRPMLRGISF